MSEWVQDLLPTALTALVGIVAIWQTSRTGQIALAFQAAEKARSRRFDLYVSVVKLAHSVLVGEAPRPKNEVDNIVAEVAVFASSEVDRAFRATLVAVGMLPRKGDDEPKRADEASRNAAYTRLLAAIRNDLHLETKATTSRRPRKIRLQSGPPPEVTV